MNIYKMPQKKKLLEKEKIDKKKGSQLDSERKKREKTD